MQDVQMTKSIMQKLLDNPGILRAMMAMPEGANNSMVETRRRKNFKFLHEHTDMTEVEVMQMVRDREQDFIQEYHEEPIPEWLMRMEAQDTLLELMHERFEEEDLL